MREPAGQEWQAIFDRMVRDTPLLLPVQNSSGHTSVSSRPPIPPEQDARDGESSVVQQTPRARELELRLSGRLARAAQLVESLAARQNELQVWLDRERQNLAEARAAERAERAAECEGYAARLVSQMAEAQSRHERRLQEFEREAAVLLDRYESAARSADAALDRADARLVAFDEGLHRLLGAAAEEIRSAAEAVRGSRQPAAEAAPGPAPAVVVDAEDRPQDAAGETRVEAGRRPALSTRIATALGVGLLLLFGFFVYRQSAAAVDRAAAAEQAAAEARSAAEGSAAASADRNARAVGDALAMAAKADRMLEILAAPDARRLDLAGRRGAPAATGQALWSRSRGVIISAVRVPPAPSGEVYQVWLTMSSGPVSLGFAAPDAQGRVGAAFDLPATVAGTVAGFHVSREPAGGSTRPQGQPVLSN
jgi:hypothetical protein